MSLIIILLLCLSLIELRLRLLKVGNLLHSNCLRSYFLCSLHILKVDVGLLSFLHHLMNLLLSEVHTRRRVLILGLDHLLTSNDVGTLLHYFLLLSSDRSLTWYRYLLVVRLSL
jgi:hypothetical protein